MSPLVQESINQASRRQIFYDYFSSIDELQESLLEGIIHEIPQDKIIIPKIDTYVPIKMDMFDFDRYDELLRKIKSFKSEMEYQSYKKRMMEGCREGKFGYPIVVEDNGYYVCLDGQARALTLLFFGLFPAVMVVKKQKKPYNRKRSKKEISKNFIV